MPDLNSLLALFNQLGSGTSEEQRREIKANQELNRQGSLMGSERQAQLQGNKSPERATLESLLNLLNPMNPNSLLGGVSGGVQAVLAPTANKTLQGLFEELRRVAPALVKRAEGVPELLHTYLTNVMPGKGMVGSFQRSKTLPQGTINIAADKSDLVSTLAHELTHGVTESKGRNIGLTQPSRALETADQLTAMMAPEQIAAMRLGYIPGVSNVQRGLWQGTPEQLLPKLQGGAPRRGVTASGAYSNVSPDTAYSEALSYLTESLLNPRGADPELESVSKALGFNIK